MILSPSRTLDELAAHAGRVIGERLKEVGSPDLDYPIEAAGDGKVAIRSVRPVEALEPGCLTFATSAGYLKIVEASEAAAVILPLGLSTEVMPFVRAPDPRLVFSVILELADERPGPTPGLPENVRFKDPAGVEIGEGSVIGDWCYVGADVRIGRNTMIHPHVFIDDQVTIGDGCIIYPRATIFRRTRIGKRVVVHAGAVIGDDGFGYNQVPDLGHGRLHHLKNHHVGRVVIEDHVEIGSQVCIDRALAGETVIGAGTKIDNLVQIGHNVKVGRDCIIVSQVGMAGNSSLGNRVFALGKAGFTTGVTVGDDAVITARASVMSNIPSGHATWSGSPARRGDLEYKQMALARRELPRLREFFRLLKKAGSFEELRDSFRGISVKKNSEKEQRK